MRVAVNSFQHKQFSYLVTTFLTSKYGDTLSAGLCKIREDLSLISDIDKLLHYLNLEPTGALRHSRYIFEPPEFDLPEDELEYSWAEVQSAPVDTYRRLYIIAMENNSATIAYFTQ